MTHDPEAPGGVPTENVQVETVTPAHAYLELQIFWGGEQEFRFPFLDSELELAAVAPGAFPADSQWRALLKGENVHLHNPVTGESHPLAAGEQVELGSTRVWLVDVRQPPVGTLEGVSAPFTGRSWHLLSQQTWLGRKGKRLNHIELDHPTISRAHSTFFPDKLGRVSLISESAGSATTVNGQPLGPGETKRLNHGDLLGFGQLMFRFSGSTGSSAAESLLSLNTLGTFAVTLGGRALGTEFRNEKARWVMALLGARWGEPEPVERLIEEFWPDVPSIRGRKNMSYTLAQLRGSLGVDEANFESLVLRTPSTLALNPARLGTHDYVEVQKLTRHQRPLSSMVALERLLNLYQGRFLPTCYEDWAEVLRTRLDRDFVATVLATARQALEQSDFDILSTAVGRLLELDPLNEEAVILLMEGELKAARPEQAVAVYEQLCRSLKAEGLEPDTEVMKLYYRASLGI